MQLVITNLPDADSAMQMAKALIAQRAAACVNVLSPCTSVYRWKGEVETTTEYLLLIKTQASAYKQVETLIRTLHPYELPEIISLPVGAALPEYLNWVCAETQNDKG